MTEAPRFNVPEMTPAQVLQSFESFGGLIQDGHFVYTSGLHGEQYFNKDAIYPHTAEISGICREMARRHADRGIGAVVGPALGGIILAQWTAHHLSEMTGRETLAIYAEKTPGGDQVIKRGQGELIAGKNVLVVEDVITTGGSVMRVINSVRGAGGEITAVCTIINRNPREVTSESIGAPLNSLVETQAEAFEPEDCPKCKQGVPVNTNIGKGKELASGTP